MDGVTYRWRIRHKPSYSQGNGWSPLTFAVEDATAPGTTLQGWTPAANGSPFLLELASATTAGD